MAKKENTPGTKRRPRSAAAGKPGAKKPIKFREISERVGDLLRLLEITPQQLSYKLTVGSSKPSSRVWPSRVHAWLSGSERPSNEAFLQLGWLATGSPPLRDWFWFQSGKLLDLAMAVGGQVLTERGELAPKAPVFNVPCRHRVGRTDEPTGETWPVNAERVTSPGSTFCLLIGDGTHSTYLWPGDAVVIDTSSAHSPDLRPFLDQIVLVDIDANKPRQLDPDRQLIHWPHGLCIGRLRIKMHQTSPTTIPIPGQRVWGGADRVTMEGSPLWLAALCAPGDLDQDWNPSGENIYLGAWIPRTSAGGFDGNSWQSWMEDCARKVTEDIRLEEACSILGRVIDWAPSGGGAHAATGRKRRKPE